MSGEERVVTNNGWIRSVRDAQDSLRIVAPEHPLLGYAAVRDDGVHVGEAFCEEYGCLDGKRLDMTGYVAALRNAAGAASKDAAQTGNK